MVCTNDNDAAFEIEKGSKSGISFCYKIPFLFRKPVMPGLIGAFDVDQYKIPCLQFGYRRSNLAGNIAVL